MALELPKNVEECPVCSGKGQYKQTYNAGCGMGLYRSIGKCDLCNGNRFLMKNAEYHNRIPSESIINQIQVANPDFDLAKIY